MAGGTEQEPGLEQIFVELRRLRRRALLRPVTVLLITSLLAGGAVLRKALHKGRYEASVTFRVLERMEGPTEHTRPTTKRRLREYVLEGIFTRETLRKVVQDYDLYPGLASFDLHRAVDAMREELHVHVFQNYFLRDDYAGTPRSARFRISYAYRDPKIAESVVRHLGEVVMEHEIKMRKTISERVAREGLRAEQTVSTRLDEQRARLTEIRVALAQISGRRRMELLAEAGQIARAVRLLEDQLSRVQSGRGLSELRQGLERNQLLLRFSLVDWSRSPAPAFSRTVRLAFVGAVSFLIFLPVVGIAVAAFDTHIYGSADVRRLGFEPLGGVPGFPSDDLGALKHRPAAPE